jgi:putative tributyrin esterase
MITNHALDWHKLEVSRPEMESDGLRFVTVRSGNLRSRGDVVLYVPPGVEKLPAVPLVTLLHGIYGSAWSWALNGGAHRTAARLIADGEIPPMVLAMPSDGLWGDGTGYATHAHADYEAWIVADVPALAERVVPACGGGSKYLAGLSMGGFGALRLGAKYGRERYQGISSHSACTRLEDLFDFVTESAAAYASVQGANPVLDTILGNRGNLPALRFDCGLSDPLLPKNRALAQALKTLGLPHVYEEFPGEHDWRYWEMHLARTLRFFGGLEGTIIRKS